MRDPFSSGPIRAIRGQIPFSLPFAVNPFPESDHETHETHEMKAETTTDYTDYTDKKSSPRNPFFYPVPSVSIRG